ncbi:MAG: prepilin-type N-terminal cleavage/methylation domain-containing protein [Sedimentisphaerales bacterium]|nr:prepilin-type N-terminal cleavage/methylation domain-containing protein [Sedimentisphaerales bacterium]
MKMKQNKYAFTLIEAMLAVAILAAAAAGILLPFASGAAVQVEGARRTMAAKLASDLLEEIIATEYTQVYSTWNGYSETEGQVKNCASTVASPVYLSGSIYDFFRREVTVTENVTFGYSYVKVRIYYKGMQLAEIGTTVYSY